MRKSYLLRLSYSLAVAGMVGILAPLQTASAQDTPQWIVTEITGQAQEQGGDGAWHSLARGSVLGEGRAVKTGPNARLVLIHGKDLVTVSPNSAFKIPASSNPASSVSVVQTLGTMLYRVEHAPQRRFEVDAPDLVAVVKGTIFTVTAGESANSVHVAGGAVQVTALLSREVTLVRPGEIAVVSSAGRDLTILTGASSAKGSERHSQYEDPDDNALGTKSAAAAPDDPSHRGNGKSAPELTQTVGEDHLDMATVTKGLIGNDGARNAPGYFAAHAPGSDDAPAADGTGSAASGNPNAMGGNANAMGGNANAMAGNPTAAAVTPSAATGALNTAAGALNAAAGNLNAAVAGLNNAASGADSAANGVSNAAAKKTHGKP
jgi:FecR protein